MELLLTCSQAWELAVDNARRLRDYPDKTCIHFIEIFRKDNLQIIMAPALFFLTRRRDVQPQKHSGQGGEIENTR